MPDHLNRRLAALALLFIFSTLVLAAFVHLHAQGKEPRDCQLCKSADMIMDRGPRPILIAATSFIFGRLAPDPVALTEPVVPSTSAHFRAPPRPSFVKS